MNAPIFATLGCRLNAYETEAMKELAAAAGLQGAVIVNTCAVTAKFKISNKNKANGEMLFLMEVEYGGVFLIEHVPEEQLHPFLMIECPRMLFPYIRRIISDVTRDGGFPPLNVDTVDFLALYRQEVARRAQAQSQAAAAAPLAN